MRFHSSIFQDDVVTFFECVSRPAKGPGISTESGQLQESTEICATGPFSQKGTNNGKDMAINF